MGIVFGDIGTSPLYTVQTVFNPDDPHPIPETVTTIQGIVSLIFWSVLVIVTCKYVLAVMRADNNGEGGIMALISLVIRTERDSKTRTPFILAAVGVFGASLFFGDSMITPAISVLSAVEGIEVVEPSLHNLVLPATATIIVCLFLIQRHGTEKVGKFFGPVMIVWFLTLAAMGIHGIAKHPAIMESLSPTHGIDFLVDDPAKGFFSLGSVVLAITGAEALFADMGHFGRSAITRAWLLLVFPALILNYLGQGALLLDSDPGTITAPFFQLVPDDLRIPLVVLATMATVIAAQAVISGAFSISTQAVQLGYLPRLHIVHTSAKEYGQVYVPWINWALMAAVLVLVFAFQTSTKLAFAYGVAVTGTFITTTILFSYLAYRRFNRPLWQVIPFAAVLLTIEGLFLASNLTKVLHGAWLPLVIGFSAFTVMTTWQMGRRVVMKEREKREGSLADFIQELHAMKPAVVRTPGKTAVFLSRGANTAPLAMRATVEGTGALHENVIVLSVDIEPVPRVPASRRLELDDLGHNKDGIHFARVHYGYMQATNVPAAVKQVEKAVGEVDFDPATATYFLTDVELEPGRSKGLSRWRKELFLATTAIATDPTEYFRLPPERTIILGSRVEF